MRNVDGAHECVRAVAIVVGGVVVEVEMMVLNWVNRVMQVGGGNVFVVAVSTRGSAGQLMVEEGEVGWRPRMP